MRLARLKSITFGLCLGALALIVGSLLIPPEHAASAQAQGDPTGPSADIVSQWASILWQAAAHNWWGFMVAVLLIVLVGLLNRSGATISKAHGWKKREAFFHSNAWRFLSVFILSFIASILTSFAAGQHFGEPVFVAAVRLAANAVAGHQGFKQVLQPAWKFFSASADDPAPELSSPQ